ncbi:MAG TPA: TlpA disulfide reductase family protein [Candidatus Nanopelagicales bacterium]|nr:TlpA disulfide reductase family protein [Candidatus Nanopelagicales bacterium]
MIWSSSFFRTTAVCASVALSALALGCGGGGAPAAGGGSETPAGEGGLVGSKAPEISASPVTGDGPKTLGEASGKVVILDFWATYCDPCKKSFPKYQEMVEEFGGDLAIIAISVDDPDDASEDKLKAFAAETGVKFPIVWDKDKSAAQKYNPPKMPTSFIIDKEGNVKHIHAGYESGEEAKIADEVKALLGK